MNYDLYLTHIARAKAQDMAQKEYVGHTSPSGYDIQTIASRLGYTMYNQLGENVA